MNKSNVNDNAANSLSQTRAILAYLRQGHTITDDECREMFYCSRLGARIKDIEKIVGYKPPRERIDVIGKKPDGTPVKKRVVQYWLHPGT